jgi:hypothetical protein
MVPVWWTARPRHEYLAKDHLGGDNSPMAILHSVRAAAVIAIFAMMLAVIAPFSAAIQMTGHDQSSVTASLASPMDCDTCPKAMAPGACMQMNCPMTATETEYSHSIVAEAISYSLLAMMPPAEWHIVPPVSPG